MEQNKAEQLLDKYLAGACSDNESILVERFYLERFKSQPLPQNLSDTDIRSQMWRYISAGTAKEEAKIKPFNWARLIRVAASVIFCLSVGGYLLLHKQPVRQNVEIRSHDIPPGNSKAILTLANGNRIILNGAKMGRVAQQGNAVVLKTKPGQIQYQVTDAAPPARVAYNTASTPRGGEYHIVLADGTNVWLNAASSITFPTTFSGNDRTVAIKGEVYFEVSHNPDKPFRVKCNGQTVEVLGTHFDINAYGDENLIKTTLLEGSVKVATGSHVVLLRPGQQADAAIVDSETCIFRTVKNVDTDEEVAWRNGLFQFDKADLKTVMRQLARWYNVDVVYQGTIRERAFSGSIHRSLSAAKALKLISYSDVHFIIDGKKIIISNN